MTFLFQHALFYLLLNQENNFKNRVNRTVKKSKGDHEKTVLLTHFWTYALSKFGKGTSTTQKAYYIVCRILTVNAIFFSIFDWCLTIFKYSSFTPYNYGYNWKPSMTKKYNVQLHAHFYGF